MEQVGYGLVAVLVLVSAAFAIMKLRKRRQEVAMFDRERAQDAEARFRRFAKLFRIQARIWELVNDVLDHADIKVRDGAERDLSLVVGASLGKALKAFDGVHQLCMAGWGEDALIVLRANVNLLINLAYILRDPEPAERAADFIAFSATERAKYLKTAHDASPPWKSSMTEDEQKIRAKRWDSVRIKERSEQVPKFHYTMGYALYSSFEHSDAMALNDYIAEWNEIGLRINAGPSDKHVEVALGHNAMVLADILVLFCDYFKIERTDVAEEIKGLLEAMHE